MTVELREGVRQKGLRRLWLATLNSRRGLVQCYRSEAAFREEVWLACVLVPTGLWLGQTAIERVVLVGSVLALLIVELLNTGIEVVVDRISVERHPLSGFAKDVGSAAVLCAIALLILTWALILWPRFF
jgi:diacylglycerol kinase (ATP)